ncbi:hypothetical protein BDP27DRAFT_552198 [Rhodocollybia butyracea]|uniref:Uncharacterized protein n=1 Tax=Rhodocollybia butyracea TaxID=206335 RepID=A0A9P5PRU2_9AGAR|nr:hypothetical protein BDP27DRAFT_552198 [Rhodocollybia butyracea]
MARPNLLCSMPFLSGPPAAKSEVPFKLAALPHDSTTLFPLTRTQEGVWIEYMMTPSSTHYNLTLKLSLPVQLESYKSSLSDVVSAIQQITRRHGILRSTFHVDRNHQPCIAEHNPLTSAPSIRIYAKPSSEQVVRDWVRQGFDLSREFAMRWVAIVDEGNLDLYGVSHHIAIDGTAMSSLCDELFTLLASDSDSPPVQLSSPSVFFNQAHLYERSFTFSPAYEAATKFWLSQVTGSSPITWREDILQVDPSRDADYRKIQFWSNFPKSELKALSNRYKTSWFRVAIAVVGVLIQSISQPRHGSRYLFNVAFGGRPMGCESTLGHFANALPIVINSLPVLDNGTKIPSMELVSTVSKLISQAKKHELLSSLDIHREARKSGLQVPRSQVAITLSPKLKHSGCTLYPVEGIWDLFFCFLEAENSVSLGVIFDPHLFSEETITDLQKSFASLMTMAAQDGAVFDISRIFGLSSPHGPSTIDPSEPPSLLARFEHQAEHNSSIHALYSAELGESMSYGSLNSLANQYALYLRNLGVGRDKTILLHIDRGFMTIVLIVAILKSGAAFVVADKTHPNERKSLIVSAARPVVLIHDSSAQDLGFITDFDGKLISISAMFVSDLPTTNLNLDISSEDLSYVIFTSGSTGRPKGVMIANHNLSFLISGALEYTDIGPGSRMLQFASFSFDASVFELSLALSTGSTICMARYPKVLIGDYLGDVIDENQINFIQVTPSVLGTLPVDRKLPSLRQISIGGEAPNGPLLECWSSRVRLVNDYGPSETAIGISAQIQQPGTKLDPTLVGRPHFGTSIFVSDTDFKRILDPSEEGEICVAGEQVGRGYIGQEKLTAERFAIHPANGIRMYRTGDRGMVLKDGTVKVLGRMDREVKIRGFRIDLPEIERVIHRCESSVEAVSVQASEDGTQLRAFVSPLKIDNIALRTCLQEYLPHYMIPSIYTVKQLPLNVSDKVDHRLIGTMQDSLMKHSLGGQQTSTSSYHSSSSMVVHNLTSENSSSQMKVDEVLTTYHEKVCEAWMSVLDLDKAPPPDANFFEVGGNSLLVHRLVEKLQDHFPNSGFTIIRLFHASTINDQIRLIHKSEPHSTLMPPPLPVVGLRKTVTESTKTVDPDIVDNLRKIWSKILGIESVQTNSNFFELGGHSLLIPRLLKEINEQWSNIKISFVTLFHQASFEQQVALISQYVNTTVQDSTMATVFSSQQQQQLPLSYAPSVTGKIAIIGLSGRFPGAADADSFYKLLLEKREGITTFSSKLPSTLNIPEGAKYIPRRGVIDGVEEFDHDMWNLTKEEAIDMDPQQRVFLDVVLSALEDAGLDGFESMRGQNRTGLFVGAAENTYHTITEATFGDPFFRANRANRAPSISARTAYHLNFQGPNITLNVNCASSTVALSVAIEHLNAGSCDIAVAGGVAIFFPQEGYTTQNGQISSPTGCCRPFNLHSDGTVPADGACALVLKRLEDATDDGDKIYAVIHGAGIGSDGQVDKAGFATPSPRGQAEVVKSTWKKARMNPSALQYVELHGSGTPIGDALELEGLLIALTDLQGSAEVTVGSCKGNIGNSQQVSGIVSLIKLCKSMQHGTIPPVYALTPETLSPLLSSMPFTFATEPVSIADNALLGVSSTGWGGVNSHIILSRPPPGYDRSTDLIRPRKQRNLHLLRAPRFSES